MDQHPRITKEDKWGLPEGFVHMGNVRHGACYHIKQLKTGNWEKDVPIFVSQESQSQMHYRNRNYKHKISMTT